MFFPISDDDRDIAGWCYVTWALVGLNIAVFIYQLVNPEFTYGWSAVPAEITTGTDLVRPILMSVAGVGPVEIPQAPGPQPIHLTLLTSMFMHGGFAHLGGNMLFLWIFGDNVEHRFGPTKFLILYLVSGLLASLAQIATGPSSVIPTLGASGAISGVLGAYLVLFPHNKVNAIFFFRVISVPAFLVIVMWAITQFLGGFGSIAQTEQTGGIAYAAHIGGFFAGVVLALILRRGLPEEPDSVLRRAYERDPGDRRWW